MQDRTGFRFIDLCGLLANKGYVQDVNANIIKDTLDVASGATSLVFTDLRKYDAQGNELEYRAVESAAAGSSGFASKANDANVGSFKMTIRGTVFDYEFTSSTQE